MKQSVGPYRVGQTIKITDFYDPYMRDYEKYIGRHGVIEFIDDIGQLHGTWGSLAIDPINDDTVEVEIINDIEDTDEVLESIKYKFNKTFRISKRRTRMINEMFNTPKRRLKRLY